MVKGYMELEVWQVAIELVDAIYDLTLGFPVDEKFGLSSQIKRAAVSVAANLAEGSGRRGTKEFINFVNISKGSIAELETHLIIARRRQFIDEAIYTGLMEKADRIDRMLFGLMNSLQRKMG